MNNYFPHMPLNAYTVNEADIEAITEYLLALILANLGCPCCKAEEILSDENPKENSVVKEHYAVESFLEILDVIRPLKAKDQFEALVEVWVFVTFKKTFSYQPVFDCKIMNKAHLAVVQFAKDFVEEDFVKAVQ